MGEDAGAPAERDPIEPPDFWRDCHVDDEQQHDHRHIGEGVDREAARVRVEKDALATDGHGHQIGGEVGKKRERAGIPRHGGQQSTDALLLCGLQ